MNGRTEDLRTALAALGDFVREKWQAISTNLTNSQMRFWTQMEIFNPENKAGRAQNDDFYFQLLDRIALRRGLTPEQRRSLRKEFDAYLRLPITRNFDNSGEVWSFWAAQRRTWSLLAPLVLLLLSAPIGNSELERSFSLVKRTSLDPHRATSSVENKSVMNKAHVNGDCKFSDIAPPQPQ